MASLEERMQILKMIEQGKISAEEGAKLLQALGAGKGEKHRPIGDEPRWFRVRVTDLDTGKNKVSMNFPMGVVSAGFKLGARFAPDVNFEEIMAAIKAGAQGKIVDVVDEEDGERVEIFIE